MPMERVAVVSMLWPSEKKATVPVGVAELAGPETLAVSVKLCPGAGVAEVVLSVTVGVSLLAVAFTVPPLPLLPNQLASPA